MNTDYEIEENLNDESRPVYTIRVVAELLGISVHTLRLYETEGFIIPHRTKSKHRLYSREDVNRLKSIRIFLEEKRLNIAGIKMLLSMIPCWNIVHCSAKDREDCDAFQDNTQPCWINKKVGGLCEELDCRECVVYKNLTPYANMKDYLRKLGEYSVRKDLQ